MPVVPRVGHGTGPQTYSRVSEHGKSHDHNVRTLEGRKTVGLRLVLCYVRLFIPNCKTAYLRGLYIE